MHADVLVRVVRNGFLVFVSCRYHSVSADIKAGCNHPVPIQKLIAFERVSLAPNVEVPVMFDIM